MLICHEHHEGSPPRAHSCSEPGICVFMSVLYLAMIHDQALMASKHFLVETENKPEGGLGRFKLILFRFTFCSPSHPPPCLRPPPASFQPQHSTPTTSPSIFLFTFTADADIAEKEGQDERVPADKEGVENSNISSTDLDTKGQDYGRGEIFSIKNPFIGGGGWECAYRLT